MNELEYQNLQEQFKNKLKKPPYEGWQSDKYHTGYEDGIKACMSILSSHHHHGDRYMATLADIEQSEDLAFRGEPMPELRSQAQVLLFLHFRNLYDYAKRIQMPPEQGTREKHEILRTYEINKFLEDLQEQTNQMWKRIDVSAMEYRKNPTIEAADKLMEAIYRVKRKES